MLYLKKQRSSSILEVEARNPDQLEEITTPEFGHRNFFLVLQYI